MMRRAWFILVLMLIATGAAAVGVWRAAPKFAGDADADVFPLAGWAVVLCGAIALGLVALAAWAVWRGRKLAVAAGLSLLLCAASAIVWARGRRGDAFNVNWCGTAGPPPEQDPAWRDPRTDPPDEPVEGKTPDATVVRVWPGGITINRGHAEPLWWSGVRLEVYDRSMA